jgi:hypothetical protein
MGLGLGKERSKRLWERERETAQRFRVPFSSVCLESDATDRYSLARRAVALTTCCVSSRYDFSVGGGGVTTYGPVGGGW